LPAWPGHTEEELASRPDCFSIQIAKKRRLQLAENKARVREFLKSGVSFHWAADGGAVGPFSRNAIYLPRTHPIYAAAPSLNPGDEPRAIFQNASASSPSTRIAGWKGCFASYGLAAPSIRCGNLRIAASTGSSVQTCLNGHSFFHNGRGGSRPESTDRLRSKRWWRRLTCHPTTG